MDLIPLDLNRCIAPFAVWERKTPSARQQIVFQSFYLKEAGDVFESKRRRLVSGEISLTDGVCRSIRHSSRFPQGVR